MYLFDLHIVMIEISALQDAAEVGDVAIVTMLIEKEVEVSHESSDGQTALHKASANGHGQVCVLSYHWLTYPKDVHSFRYFRLCKPFCCLLMHIQITVICRLRPPPL